MIFPSYLFLVLQAYAYALTKVEDEGDVRAFHSLIGSVLDELGLHASYAAKWGLDIHNVSPDKYRYTLKCTCNRENCFNDVRTLGKRRPNPLFL